MPIYMHIHCTYHTYIYPYHANILSKGLRISTFYSKSIRAQRHIRNENTEDKKDVARKGSVEAEKERKAQEAYMRQVKKRTS